MYIYFKELLLFLIFIKLTLYQKKKFFIFKIKKILKIEILKIEKKKFQINFINFIIKQLNFIYNLK